MPAEEQQDENDQGSSGRRGKKKRPRIQKWPLKVFQVTVELTFSSEPDRSCDRATCTGKVVGAAESGGSYGVRRDTIAAQFYRSLVFLFFCWHRRMRTRTYHEPAGFEKWW